MVEKQHAEAIENNQEVLTNQGPDVVIITGMSGAGRTEAMHTFEDLGYFCIDNLPPSLIMNMISLASLPGHSEIGRKLAIVCDARNREYFKQLVGELANVEAAGITFRIIFLDARDEILIARYKASRRRHPLCVNNSRSIAQAIAYERKLTQELRDVAHSYIDTSDMKPRELREVLRSIYSKETDKDGMNVVVYSFGFKHFEQEIYVSVTGRFGTNERTSEFEAFSGERSGIFPSQFFVHAVHITHFATAHTYITGRNVGLRTDVSPQFGNEGLAEAHDFGIGFTARAEIRTSFTSTHGECGQ